MLDWFRLTHACEAGFGWRRSVLPYDGGLAQQPAKLIAALDFVAHQRNSVMAATVKTNRNAK